MTILLASVAIVGGLAVLVLLVGTAANLTKAIHKLAAAATLQAWATNRSATASEEAVIVAKAQIEMNRQLVEAVKHAPPASARVN